MQGLGRPGQSALTPAVQECAVEASTKSSGTTQHESRAAFSQNNAKFVRRKITEGVWETRTHTRALARVRTHRSHESSPHNRGGFGQMMHEQRCSFRFRDHLFPSSFISRASLLPEPLSPPSPVLQRFRRAKESISPDSNRSGVSELAQIIGFVPFDGAQGAGATNLVETLSMKRGQSSSVSADPHRDKGWANSCSSRTGSLISS